MSDISSEDRELAAAFKALGHPVRIALVRRILSGNPCVSELHECVGQSQPSISQHLGVLRDRGLIVPERDGNRTCYRPSDERLGELLKIAEDIMAS